MNNGWKHFLSLVFFILLGLWCYKAHGAEPRVQYKMCLTGKIKATGEMGCWNGAENVSFSDWLKNIDPKMVYIRATYDREYVGGPAVIQYKKESN